MKPDTIEAHNQADDTPPVAGHSHGERVRRSILDASKTMTDEQVAAAVAQRVLHLNAWLEAVRRRNLIIALRVADSSSRTGNERRTHTPCVKVTVSRPL